jgi:hypothetical protein
MYTIALAAAAVIAIGLSTLEIPPRGAEPAGEKLKSLSWIAGHWRSDDFETFYSTPEGGVIMSLSKGYSDGAASFVEFEKIHVVGNDVLLTPLIIFSFSSREMMRASSRCCGSIFIG